MMIAGDDVTIDADETVLTGTGMKRAIFDADVASSTYPTVPTPGSTSPPFRTERPANSDDVAIVVAARVAQLREQARKANAMGYAIYTYVTTYGEAVIINESCGVTPDPNDPATAITPPPAPVYLAIV